MELEVERDDMSSSSGSGSEQALLSRKHLRKQTPAYSSSFSFSSNDLPVVSLVKKYVTTTPTRLTPPRIISDAFIPIPFGYPFSSRSCDAHRKPTAPMIAPIFPAAPEIPWQVDLNLAGKSSAGRMKVVVLGPKFEKKNVRQ